MQQTMMSDEGRQLVTEVLDYTPSTPSRKRRGPPSPTVHAVEIAGEDDVFRAPGVGPAEYTAHQLREWCERAGVRLVLMRWAR